MFFPKDFSRGIDLQANQLGRLSHRTERGLSQLGRTQESHQFLWKEANKKKTHRGEIVYCGWGKGRGCGCSWRCFFLNESLFYLDFLGANEVKKVVCLEFIWLRDWWLSHLRAKDDRINPENSKDSFWIRMFGAQRVDLSKGLVFSTLRKCFPFFVSSQEKHTNRELMITPSWNFPSSQVV